MKVQLGFYKGSQWFDIIEMLFNHCRRETHVCFIFKDGDNIFKYEARTEVGVIKTDIMNYRGQWTLDIYDVDNINDDDACKLLEWCKSQADRKIQYDYTGVLAFIIKWLHQDPTRYFCSEFVMDGFKFINKPLLDMESSKTKPSTIVRLCDKINLVGVIESEYKK